MGTIGFVQLVDSTRAHKALHLGYHVAKLIVECEAYLFVGLQDFECLFYLV